MRSYHIRACRHPLRGSTKVPADKSIAHRAVMFAALARSSSTLRGFSGGLDNRATLQAFAAMGVHHREQGNTLHIEGVGLRGLRAPQGDIQCGNSGTTMRMLAGILVGQPFGCRLIGDASLSQRPMRRIIAPLRARGAHIDGRPAVSRGATSHTSADGSSAPEEGSTSEERFPPIAIAPLVEGEHLQGIEYAMQVASAQVNSALLLSGLYAKGVTAIQEPVLSRDHTERMLMHLGVPLQTAASMVVLDPSEWAASQEGAPGWDGFSWDLPGDPSSAAFMAAAALLVRGSEVTIDDVCTNPTRTGFFDALRWMNANMTLTPRGHASGGEPIGSMHVQHDGALRAVNIGGEMLVRMIDEVPAFCALAAAAQGRSEVRDAAELRVKESDRIRTMFEVLSAFGVPCEELPDGLVIHGVAQTKPARVQSHGDHRIAMSSVLLALRAEGESTVDDVDCVDTSFPGFVPMLRSLGVDIEVRDGAGHGSLAPSVSASASPAPASATEHDGAQKAQNRPTASQKRSRPIVAIDGPAGAGKSTIAKAVAQALGFVLIDTGALYRGVALATKEAGLAPGHAEKVFLHEGEARISLHFVDGESLLFLDGRDRSADIRSREISGLASQVSALPAVRAHLLALQREMGAGGGVVMEGRDIGSVIFPEAEAKIYLTASLDARTQRRAAQLQASGMPVADEDALRREVQDRDEMDRNRDHAPLVQAADAHVIDSSQRSIDDIVQEIVALVRRVSQPASPTS